MEQKKTSGQSSKTSLKKIWDEVELNPDLLVLAEDEAALSSIATITRMWAKKGCQPFVAIDTRTQKQHANLFGAVSLFTNEHYSVIADRGNRETFWNFIEYILEENPDREIIMILDNVKFHHAKIIKEIRLPKVKRLKFVFLPAYSPDLNPQEWVWEEMRRKVTHNTYYEKFTDKIKAAHDFLKSYELPKVNLLCRIIY